MGNGALTLLTADMAMGDIAPMARHGFKNIVCFLNGEAITPADLIVNPRLPRADGAGRVSGRKDAIL
jgi:hypothetical protein